MLKHVVRALICLPLAAAFISAQTSGNIAGTVRDASGSPVAGAMVTVTNVDKQTSQTITTDPGGGYSAPFLPPGTYQLSVEKSGFDKQVSAATQLDVDQKARIDFTLQIGNVQQTVEVSATAPLIRSESAELGEVIGQKSVQDLPLNGRNFAQLVYLVPGVTTGQAGENLSGASTFNPRAGSNFNALGSQANSNAWLVDGIVDNEFTFNTVMVQPSVESVQEFKVLTGTYSAEYGRGAGVVTTQTRSGNNQFHGSLFEFLRNSYLDARNYFNTASSQEQPPYRRNQFGAAIGGPIVKNKTFFFADYYGWREIKGQTFVNTVPTADERGGDFSALGATIYNPYTTTTDANGNTVRTPFPNNKIPASLISSVGANVAGIYPLPNQPGLINNRVDTLNRNLDDNGGNIRIDHRFNEKDSLFGRYSFEQFNLFDTKGQGGCCIPTPSGLTQFDLGPYIAGGQNTTLAASGLALNETHVFSAAVVNEAVIGFARTNPLTRQSDYGHNAAASLGIQGINLSEYSSGLPTINIGGAGGGTSYTSINGGPAFLPANPRQTSYQIQDNLSWTRGSHSLKFGYRVIQNRTSPFTNTNTRSTLNFNMNLTNDPVTGEGGSGLASLLLGLLANGNSASGSRGFLQTPYYLTNYEHALYAQDDWKVTSRLTLNLGIRWDLFTPYTEERNRLTNFDLTSLALIYAGVNRVSDTANVKTRWNNFAPRVGFAYDVTGKGTTVIRGGYAISYFPEQPSASNMLGQQVPWTISQNTATTALYPTDLSTVARINNPFSAPTSVQPMTTAELIAANPSILGQSTENQTPYFETYSFNVEHQFSNNVLLEVAYAGSRSIHLLYCYNPQEVQPGPSGVPASQRITIPAISGLRSITQCDNRNMSNYNGLNVKFTKRLASGLNLLASYSWSKSLDYGGSAASGGGSVGNPQTVTNFAAGYGVSGFDVPHRFVGSWTWELPFGAGKRFVKNNRALSYAVGGWQLSGIATIQSGLAFTVTENNCVNNATSCWPDVVGSTSVSNRSYSNWYNASAFAAPCQVAVTSSGVCTQYAYRYGNEGRGILRAPGMFNFDLSASKSFAIKERFNLLFRIDAFNALNHPQMGFPNTSINVDNPSNTSTAITSTIGDNRDIQAALKLTF